MKSYRTQIKINALSLCAFLLSQQVPFELDYSYGYGEDEKITYVFNVAILSVILDTKIQEILNKP